ncbi:uncharacterized protein BP5553_05561 [Venustampulla echinocandica]|uniref:Nucleotide-diphospho-sugar transferase n=1 Tax=Venustampulla echinocandica TaxID=2656787 RepID=A0A370TRK1_9HELO|nr:uncharacterized protein BP5553_05561 [Venustampulla echinocandica]RDL38128.1 hypothetical protein BP5553_05561 [Venustampulla echinocandica]
MPVNPRSDKRRNSDTPPQYDQEIPSFLESSPFFLPPSGEFEPHRHQHQHQPRPTLRQLLRSRRVLSLMLTAVALTTFLIFLWNGAEERMSQKLGRLGLLPGGGTKCLYDASKQSVVPPDPNSGTAIDWKTNAYATYVTGGEYLCNAVMIFESLARMESKAARLLLYPNTAEFSLSNGVGLEENRRLLVKARDEYGVNLVPIKVIHKKLNYHLWQDSYTKLLVFNQTQYTRVLFLDSDATVLSPMDELFLLPPCSAAMPRAYWLKKPVLTSHIMLIQPSASEFARVNKAIKKAGLGTYDMEIVNRLYGTDCVVLPHRRNWGKPPVGSRKNVVRGEAGPFFRPSSAETVDAYHDG